MPVKVYSSIQQGAPIINGVNGSFIDVLDAVLVNGYGQVDVTSITHSGVTATVTTASPHGFSTGDVVLIAGANETEYNGEFVATVTSGTSFTYDVVGSPSTPATGTITTKRAPGGFTKVFDDLYKAVYRSNDPNSRGHYFRVVDDGTTSGGPREARLWGYETMSDVDTGTGMYPIPGQYANGFFCQKSLTSDSTARHWIIITDGKTVYGFVYVQDNLGNSISYPSDRIGSFGFGDGLENKPGDAYLSWVTGSSLSNQFDNTRSGLFRSYRWGNYFSPPSSPTIVVARDFTGVPGAWHMFPFTLGVSDHLGYTQMIEYPHKIDNGFYMVPVMLAQGPSLVIRGRLPGFFEPMHGRCFPNMHIIDNVVGFPGRKFMMLWGISDGNRCVAVVDITGPWDS